VKVKAEAQEEKVVKGKAEPRKKGREAKAEPSQEENVVKVKAEKPKKENVVKTEPEAQEGKGRQGRTKKEKVVRGREAQEGQYQPEVEIPDIVPKRLN
jgi:hypothetical protein